MFVWLRAQTGHTFFYYCHWFPGLSRKRVGNFKISNQSNIRNDVSFLLFNYFLDWVFNDFIFMEAEEKISAYTIAIYAYIFLVGQTSWNLL